LHLAFHQALAGCGDPLLGCGELVREPFGVGLFRILDGLQFRLGGLSLLQAFAEILGLRVRLPDLGFGLLPVERLLLGLRLLGVIRGLAAVLLGAVSSTVSSAADSCCSLLCSVSSGMTNRPSRGCGNEKGRHQGDLVQNGERDWSRALLAPA
jgi:hypothetical protein